MAFFGAPTYTAPLGIGAPAGTFIDPAATFMGMGPMGGFGPETFSYGGGYPYGPVGGAMPYGGTMMPYGGTMMQQTHIQPVAIDVPPAPTYVDSAFPGTTVAPIHHARRRPKPTYRDHGLFRYAMNAEKRHTPAGYGFWGDHDD